MDAIVLAGGFATRLYPLTRNFPKPLLPINGVPVIDYIIRKLNEIPEIDKIIISTNSKFEEHFSRWLQGHKQFKQMILHVEKSSSENEKLGAVAALGEIFDTYNDAEDYLIVAGDNLFSDSLNAFTSFFYTMKKQTKSAIESDVQMHRDIVVVALIQQQQQQYHNNIKKSLASVSMDPKSAMITKFVEKSPTENSDLIGTSIYAVSNNCLKKIKGSYLLEKGNNPDSPGYFIEWLSKRDDVEIYGYIFSQRWWDIGTMESYTAAEKYFTEEDASSSSPRASSSSVA